MQKVRKKKEVKCLYCNKKEIVYLSRSKNYKFCSKDCSKKYKTNTKLNIGYKINNWEIVDNFLIRRFGRMYLKVKCTCGSNIETFIPKHHIYSKLSKGCKECNMFYTSKGYKLLSGEYWNDIKLKASKRNIDFNIQIEDAYAKIEMQDFKCALTGLELKFNKNTTNGKKFDSKNKTASLDRIDSLKGYEINNIQWLHKDVNIMKNKYNQEYFINMCKLICKKN